MYNSNKPIYKILNEIGKKEGFDYNLNIYSTFEEISAAFEELRKVVDLSTRRKLQLEYKMYVATVQEKNKYENTTKLTGRDLASLINDFDNEPVKKYGDSNKMESDKIIKLPSAINGFAPQRDNKKKNTDGLHETLPTGKKLKIAIAALGILVVIATYSGINIHKNDVKTVEPTSVSDVASDYGEYDLVEYEIQNGDFSKEIIAKKLGTTPDQIEIVGELSKQAGDIAQIKVFDRIAADDYNYTHKPVVDVEYDYYITPGTNSLIIVAAEMMAEHPLLEEYYFSYDNPTNKLASDLASQSQNKGVISSVSQFREGNISIKLKITKAMADAYNIKSNIKV